MDKRIITAAITGGIHTPTMTPYLPITPKQIADEAARACEAGAAVAHIHARDPDTGKPTPDLDTIGEIISDVKSRCDIVLCISTGGGLGMSAQDRSAHVPRYKAELASLNFGSMNFALFPAIQKFKEFKYDWMVDLI